MGDPRIPESVRTIIHDAFQPHRGTRNKIMPGEGFFGGGVSRWDFFEFFMPHWGILACTVPHRGTLEGILPHWGILKGFLPHWGTLKGFIGKNISIA